MRMRRDKQRSEDGMVHSLGVLALLGCPTDDEAPGPALVDVVATEDSGTIAPPAADTADSGTAASPPTETGTAASGVEPSPYWDWDGLPVTWSGDVIVATGTLHLPGYALDYGSIYAWFYTPGGTSGAMYQHTEYDPLENADDCGLFAESAEGIITYPTGPLRQDQTAGTVTATLPDGTEIGLAPAYQQYSADLGDTAQTGVYALAATGGQAAGFASQELVTLPTVLTLASPVLSWGAVLAAEDTDFVWTGTSDVPVRLDITAGDGSHWWYLSCNWIDDGEATLPGVLLDQLPRGTISFRLGRVSLTETTLPDGRVIGGLGLRQVLVSELALE